MRKVIRKHSATSMEIIPNIKHYSRTLREGKIYRPTKAQHYEMSIYSLLLQNSRIVHYEKDIHSIGRQVVTLLHTGRINGLHTDNQRHQLPGFKFLAFDKFSRKIFI